jgi:hypothetical protein
LYLLEEDADLTNPAPHPLTNFELATRLSYFIQSAPPDDALSTAAALGTLGTDAGLSQEVDRLLAGAKASALVDQFASQWLPLRDLDRAQPNPNTYPDFDEALRESMRNETRYLFQDIVRGTSSVRDLLVSDHSYLDDRLAAHYGLSAVGSSEPVLVTLSGTGRLGFLTHASFLTSYAHPTETAPVLRGHWIMSRLLCEHVPPPPPGVPAEPSPVTGQSRRERLAEHRENPTCGACHSVMDPIGLSLENYDVVGRHREADQGVPIDPSGTLPDGRSFSGPSELAQMIADDPKFPACVARNLYVYALGRDVLPGTVDQATLLELTARFVEGGFAFAELVRGVALSPAFRTRRPPTEIGAAAP